MKFLFAVSTLIGTIVGLGMFGLPYTVAKAGFFVGVLYLCVLGLVFMTLHLILGEIVDRSQERHRLTGYVEKYLGRGWKKFIGAIIIFGSYSALLAYVIVGGKFLSIILPGLFEERFLSVIFWMVLSAGVWLGVKTIGKIELVM